jgi:dihydroorotase
VKVYPQGEFLFPSTEEYRPPNYLLGVTTNSSSGVASYHEFFPVFAAMEKHDLVLNLHGEVPSGPDSDITVLSAEEAFLPTLFELHQRFPKVVPLKL